MARVTVEDCVELIPNRFELVMVASQRAKDIAAGSAITLPRDNDKNTVVSLREIADETVSIEELQQSLVIGLQKFVEVEEPEEEELEILAAEKELSGLDEEFSAILIDTDLEEMSIDTDVEEDDEELDLDLDDDISFEDDLDIEDDSDDI